MNRIIIKRITIVSGIIIVIAVIGLTIIEKGVFALNGEARIINSVLGQAGKVLKENKDVLVDINRKLLGAIPNPDVIATVQGLPISIGELKLRQGLQEALAGTNVAPNIIFNKLIEEKLLLYEAARNGLLATEDEVNTLIDKERLEYSSGGERKMFDDLIMQSSGLQPELYWNGYERYNVFRLISIGKIEQEWLNEAQANGRLVNNDNLDPASTIVKKEFLRNRIADLKRKADIQIIDPRVEQELHLVVERDRVYRL